MDAFNRALSVLQRFGHDASRQEQFLDAHQQGCCYLCHVPYANTIPDCPCPHWFVMPWPSAARLAPILEMYGLSGVLHYLLPYVHAGRSARRPYQVLTACTTESDMAVSIRLRSRQWSFSLPRSACSAPPNLVIRMRTRAKKDFSTKIASTARDVEIMRHIVDSVGGGIRAN